MESTDVNTTTPPGHGLLRQDSANKDVSSSSCVESDSHSSATVGCISNAVDTRGELTERVNKIRLENKDSGECTSSSLAVVMARTVTASKVGMFEEEEEGELDYEEDEGEPVGIDEGKSGTKSDAGVQNNLKEEGELEEGELDEEGEEGEILSDEDSKGKVGKEQDKEKEGIKETDGLEEGEVIEDGDSVGGVPTKRKICRYFTYGSCTWGMACRFLHPGLNDKGAYQMLPVPGQYPSPFPKAPSSVPVISPDSVPQTQMTPPFIDHDTSPVDDEGGDEFMPPVPEVIAPPKKETAWERGLKLAKEIKKAAQKRKEEDADFEQKRMSLGITADEDEDEHDKENLARRRDLRSRLEKDSTYRDEDESRARRPEDVVSRWRDKRDPSPQYRDRERRKRRGNRSPSSSPERDRRSSRRRAVEKDKSKDKTKEKSKDKEKDRTKKTTKEDEKKREDKAKKQKERAKAPESTKERMATDEERKDEAVKEQKEKDVKESVSLPEQDEKRNKIERVEEETKEKKAEDVKVHVKPEPGKELSRNSYGDPGEDEKDKPRLKTLGISSSRLPNDEWMDPWQRTTSPKRHSPSSRSSRSRSSSSSSDSSRSSRSHSKSDSESRSTSRSGSRSHSRSVSRSPSRSPSHSRSGSRSKSRSRSGSRSSASDRSSSTGSSSHTKDVTAAPEETPQDGAAKEASESESESDSESSRSASSASPPPVQKSPVKPRLSVDQGPRTLQQEPPSNEKVREKGNRYEHGRVDRTDKWRDGQLRQARPWDRKAAGVRQEGQMYRGRDYHYRKGRSQERRRRSRSPREREEDRRRRDEGRTRRRSSSADSMEHALARPSSPRPPRDRSGARAGSSGSSSDSESGSSEGSESDSQSEQENPARMRRSALGSVKKAPNVPLTSGNIRYAGHKDIKLTLNKSVGKTESSRPSSKPHSPPSRSEPTSSSDKQPVVKKRPRDSSPVHNAAGHPKELVSSSESHGAAKPVRRSADSQAEAASSGKSNLGSTSSRREELLRELKAVEDAIARKRARIE